MKRIAITLPDVSFYFLPIQSPDKELVCACTYTHITNAFVIHTIPSSHPVVVSPLSAVHPNISSSSLNGVPITSVVNKIITTATA